MLRWIVIIAVVAFPSIASAGKRVDAAALEALRRAGSLEIAADPAVTAALDVGVVVCVGKTGKVTSTKVSSPSGDEAYDQLVVETITTTWRFHPYKKRKKAMAVCATFAIAYVPAKPETVAPTALEAIRVGGNKSIVPDQATKDAIAAAGKTRIVVPVKLCVDVTGAVYLVAILKSSGFTDYDDKIKGEMATWKYRPFLVNGQAVAVCTAVTFIYVQK